jgi:hypothetical protein
MLHEVWPGNLPAVRAAIEAEWSRLPLAADSCDLVLGDCSFTAVRFPEGHRAVLKMAAKLVSPGAMLVIRYRVRPPIAQSIQEIFDVPHAGPNDSFHAFKMRLAMALQPSSPQGVTMNEIWDAFERRVTNRSQWGRQYGWPRTDIDTIDLYRGKSVRFWFPTLDELRSVHAERFVEQAMHATEGESGRRYPIFELRPSGVS